jgi:hypothetical protein
MRIPTWLSAALVLAALPAVAQMEKRGDELYDEKTFSATNPVIGAQVPDLVLCDLDGRPWALSALKGSTVVIVKCGLT